MEKIVNIYKKNKEIINYLIFGVLTTLVNIIVFEISANWIHIHYLVSNIIAWFLSVLFAYITNRKYVFESNDQEIGKEMAKFFSSRLATLGLDMVIMWLLVDILTANNLLAKIIANILVVIGNYILSKLIVFNDKEDH
ncbi:GtrA family protein [Dubosiella newyorkensis]|uniref:GtrA family protein n=1 Tax=Dubosiella newyorkensis TaxID=1862672 RepID=UPI0027296868|nr:GtrA family protein [Dubosiella newyorkensis]